jgi:hypothetical protein
MGYSSRQGSHQVAQNVTTSGFPRYCCTNLWYPGASISAGSRGATVFAACGLCGAASALAPAKKHNSTNRLRILIIVPLTFILSIALPVEKLNPPAYNDLSRLSLQATSWYKDFFAGRADFTESPGLKFEKGDLEWLT